MRYLTADYIFPVSSPPIQNGVVAINDDGTIEDIVTQQGAPSGSTKNQKLETYRGIICPGFINAHCHLELSHLKGKINEGKSLTGFIKEIVQQRNASKEEIEKAIVIAEDEMIANGIVGIGDICNTADTFTQKAKGRLNYYNFIELFDLDDSKAEQAFNDGRKLEEQSKIYNLKSIISLVPHAPYSVSPKLLKLISDYAVANSSLLSIHNQETASENEMFVSGKGELLDTMRALVPTYNNWQPTENNSLAYILKYLRDNKLLLVHNTYTTEADFSNLKSLYWCFCPNANLYIEKRLPDFQLFIDAACKIAVGTDSYASNWSLSVLDELKTIHQHAPQIPLSTLLQWATLNGAEFFEWDKTLGSIEKGKKPGLNLIEQADLSKMQLTKRSTVKKIA